MSPPLLQIYPHYAACTQRFPSALSPPRMRVLRLSVTDLCNFRCCYCMSSTGLREESHAAPLPLEELASLVAWLVHYAGIRRIRLTGGEPLVRPGIERLVAQISTLPEIQEVSLTTNGSLLSGMAWSLKAAGLKRVNVSLDSVDEGRFAEVTRGGNLKRTLAGIVAAHEAGLKPIKLNAVLRRSTWEQEVPALLNYAADKGFEIRFIELMRTGTERAWCESEFIPVDEVCKMLGAETVALDALSRTPSRTTLVNWQGTLVTAGWIAPRSHPFCGGCERLRMDARGKVRRCLMDPTTFDLRRALKSSGDVTVGRQLQSYVAGKVPPARMDSPSAMSQLGG